MMKFLRHGRKMLKKLLPGTRAVNLGGRWLPVGRVHTSPRSLVAGTRFSCCSFACFVALGSFWGLGLVSC